MCKVYNPVGCLTTIKTHLAQHKIDSFHSLHQLLSFQHSYATARQTILSKQKGLLTAERNELRAEVLLLEKEIDDTKIQIRQELRSEIEDLRRQFDQVAEAEKNYVQEVTHSFKALFILIKINCIDLFSPVIIYFSLRSKIKIRTKKRKRLLYYDSNFEKAVEERCGLALHDLDRKKTVIDQIDTFIYGALGEQKVVRELEQLSDEYTLINDFTFSFPKAIYFAQEKQYIRSIQIDHLLISPSGIFIIETKNWSEESLNNLSLRSPVQQIKRTNFALFKILSDISSFKLDQHHWGERKIPMRNIIVLINHKPKEEFQYVKILTLNELLGYIGYFKPSLSNQETQGISNYLVKMAVKRYAIPEITY